MTVEDLMNYVLTQIVPITNKYKDLNICNVGQDKMCVNPAPWRIPGNGCCTDCPHHTIAKGCTIVNLCCIAFFCYKVKDKIDPLDWKKLKSILIILQGLGLEPRTTWEEQIRTLDIMQQSLLDCTMDDLYNLCKIIFEHEK